MNVLFHDIHKYDTLNLAPHRLIGSKHDEVLFADDTICMSENAAAITRLLHDIEFESAKYGLKLNKNKCELLNLGKQKTVKFADGTPVNKVFEAKYLGVYVNQDDDINTEISKRISETTITWRKLGIFFKRSNATQRFKLTVYNAVVRAKLMYGLESAQLTAKHKKRLDVFQRRGLRQITKMKSTAWNRENDNEHLMRTANNMVREELQRKATVNLENLDPASLKARLTPRSSV